MDCNYTLISSNEIGNVMHCKDCDKLMIGLGTVIIKFDISQSKIFVRALINAHKKANELAEDGEKIFLKTPVNNLMIALNENELNQAIEILEMALLQIEIDELTSIPN